MRAITYSRVSTSHHDQNPDVQVTVLEKYCHDRQWTVISAIVDHGYSGGTDQRPGLKKLLAMARSRQVDVVVVTKLDRLFRSLKHLISVLDEFQSLGVQFVSIGDQIDLTSASGLLMLHIIGAFSEFQKNLIRDLTLAGLAYAREQGKVLGRPKIHDERKILQLRNDGLSYRAIAKQLKVPMGTITKAIRGAHQTPQKINQKFPTFPNKIKGRK